MNTDKTEQEPASHKKQGHAPNVSPLDRFRTDFERVFEKQVKVSQSGHTGDIVAR